MATWYRTQSLVSSSAVSAHSVVSWSLLYLCPSSSQTLLVSISRVSAPTSDELRKWVTDELIITVNHIIIIISSFISVVMHVPGQWINASFVTSFFHWSICCWQCRFVSTISIYSLTLHIIPGATFEVRNYLIKPVRRNLTINIENNKI